MAKLTEEMVIARSRQSDLTGIKKLNCWGSDLNDVSIIRRMRGVEVLALSVNEISTLADFEECHRLQELYLRKNKIPDLTELAYIQNLPNLKNLWLEENPCVEKAGPKYRMIVLRALPNLTKLDNVDVTPEEVDEALRATGTKEQSLYEDPQYQEPAARHQTSPSPECPEYVEENLNETFNRSPEPVSPQQRSASSEQDGLYSSANAIIHSNINSNNNGGRGTLASSISTQSMKEYYQSDYQRTPNGVGQYRHSQTDLSEFDEHNGIGRGADSGQAQRVQRNPTYSDRDVPGSSGNYGRPFINRDEWEEGRQDRSRRVSSANMEHRRAESRFNDSTVVPNSVLNHYASLQRRPTHRNSNILSATLCLIKELDLSSLEVVEHAIRCRIDELHPHAD